MDPNLQLCIRSGDLTYSVVMTVNNAVSGTGKLLGE